jgi:hypothetical protein
MRKPGKILLLMTGILFPLLLCEIVLQVAAYASAQKALQEVSQTPLKTEGENVVLCLGDSYTYGSGSTSKEKSYPGQLGSLLHQGRQEGQRWRVVNGGWPGRNSAELLQRLPEFLRQYQPDYACILIGLNNRWSRADMELQHPESNAKATSRGFQWRFRTGRLIAIAWANLWAEPNPEEQPAVGPKKQRPQRPPADADRRRRLRERASRHDDEIVLTGPPSTSLEYKTLRMADKHFRDQELAKAEHVVQEVKGRVLAMHDQSTAELCLTMLGKIKRHEDAIEFGRATLEKYGKSMVICGRLVEPIARMEDANEALQLAEQAIALQEPGEEQAWLYRSRALVYAKMKNYDMMLRDAVYCFTFEAKEAHLESRLRKAIVQAPDSMQRFPEIVMAMDIDAVVKKWAVEIHTRILEENASAQDEGKNVLVPGLEEDLLALVSILREKGIHPVLVTYPMPRTDASDCLRAVGLDLRVPLVDPGLRFGEILKSSPWEEYFIPDRHCNDKGYGVMASMIARVIQELHRSDA